jgi:hypothetical protein
MALLRLARGEAPVRRLKALLKALSVAGAWLELISSELADLEPLADAVAGDRGRMI